jgi:ATP synthase protein I
MSAPDKDQRPSDDELSARLRSLGRSLDQGAAERGERRGAPKEQPKGPSPLGQAFRMSGEFVAGVIAGGLVGWAFDRFLGTGPWGFIIFLMLGFCAGIFNVARASGFIAPSKTQKPPGS